MKWSEKTRSVLWRSRSVFRGIGLVIVVHLALYALHEYYQRQSVELEREIFKKYFPEAEAWGGYRVLWNVMPAKRTNERKQRDNDVTLLTQCSVNNLHYVTEMLQRWDGPISVALFVPGRHAFTAALCLEMIARCYDTERLTFHLVYPTSHPPAFDSTSVWFRHYNVNVNQNPLRYPHCRKVRETLQSVNATNYALGGIPYPHNTLRNVAKRGSGTRYVLLLDVDVMPSQGVRHVFLKYIGQQEESRRNRTVFVLPAFELLENMPLPRSKTKLVRAFALGAVRPFHVETCPQCHHATKYEDWFALEVNSSVAVAFELTWAPSWEPFYLGLADVPDYDERFKQYGFDRISQVCEMHAAGYRFQLMANAFVVHKGFKSKKSFHRSKDEENRRNWFLYEHVFNQELKLKYPDSKRSCLVGSKRQGKSKVSFKQHFKLNTKTKLIRDQNEEL